MPRPLRQDFPGAFHHVTTRGVDGMAVFRDDRDRLVYLRIAGKALAAAGLTCLTYALMPNHIHLVVISRDAALAKGMQLLDGGYAQWFNRRHGRRGPLWQGRYHPEPIRSDRHLLESVAYVADNPVRAGLAASADEWRWSGHAALAGQVRDPLVDVETTLAHYAADGGDARERYRAYVTSRLLRRKEGLTPFGGAGTPCSGGLS